MKLSCFNSFNFLQVGAPLFIYVFIKRQFTYFEISVFNCKIKLLSFCFLLTI